MNLPARLMALAAALVSAAIVPGCNNSFGERAGTQSAQASVPGEYLVTIPGDADEKSIADLYGRFGIRALRPLGNGVFLISLSQDPGLAVMQELAGRDRRIKSVQPNFRYRGQS